MSENMDLALNAKTSIRVAEAMEYHETGHHNILAGLIPAREMIFIPLARSCLLGCLWLFLVRYLARQLTGAQPA